MLAAFSVLVVVFLLQGQSTEESGLEAHTTRWMALNYFGLMIWIFVWMIDQTRMRGKNPLGLGTNVYGCSFSNLDGTRALSSAANET